MSEANIFTVCVVCAVPVETEALTRVFSRRAHRQFNKEFDKSCGDFREMTITNRQREPLRLVLSWLPKYGPIEMALHLPRLIAAAGQR